MKKKYLLGVTVIGFVFIMGCGGSSGGGGGGTGATLTGTVNTFTAALETEKKSFFARIKDFLLPTATAQASGVTVTVGNQSTTTDANGSFTLSDIPEGNNTVTFTQNSASADYSLMGVAEGETFTLNDVNVNGATITTAHTGTWTGTIDLGDGTYTMTMTIAANGNSLSGTLVVEGVDERGTFSGVENGTNIEASYEVHDPNDCFLNGPLTGTFSGNTLEGNAPVTEDSCGLQPGDDDPDSHAFTLTKQ